MVTEIATQENSYREAFRTLQADNQESSASWLVRVRENAMTQFEELGFPSVKEEEWKYTNVAPIARANFKPLVAPETKALGLDDDKFANFAVVEAKDSQLV